MVNVCQIQTDVHIKNKPHWEEQFPVKKREWQSPDFVTLPRSIIERAKIQAILPSHLETFCPECHQSC